MKPLSHGSNIDTSFRYDSMNSISVIGAGFTESSNTKDDLTQTDRFHFPS